MGIVLLLFIQIICDEVKIFIVQRNLPLAIFDHLASLVRDIFRDRMVTKKYASY